MAENKVHGYDFVDNGSISEITIKFYKKPDFKKIVATVEIGIDRYYFQQDYCYTPSSYINDDEHRIQWAESWINRAMRDFCEDKQFKTALAKFFPIIYFWWHKEEHQNE